MSYVCTWQTCVYLQCVEYVWCVWCGVPLGRASPVYVCIVCIREVHVCGMYVCGVYTWRDVVCVWPCLWYVRGGACMCVCGMSVRPPGPKEP